MKKFYYFFVAVLLLSVMSMSGCGSGGGGDLKSDDDEKERTQGGSNYPVKQVAVIQSPALERYRSYKIFTDAKLSGIGDFQYYVANIGSEASQSVLNLGFSDELSADQSLVIVNSSTGDVVFAYNPEGEYGQWKASGNIKFSGGKQLRYRSLTIDKSVEDSIMSAVSFGNIYDSVTEIQLNGSSATYQSPDDSASQKIQEYDYVWHCEPDHEDEYYTDGINGTTEFDSYEVDDDIFIAHDIRYMSNSLNFTESQTIKDDDEDEYAVYYSSSVGSSYVFATLPVVQGSTLSETKSKMTHSARQAYSNPVLHIAKSGVYSLKGTWNGQILIEADSVIILDGVTVTCTVAPAVIFYKDLTEYGEIDESTITSNYRTLGESLIETLVENKSSLAIISDGSENNITGSNVYRMLKPELKTSGTEQKKRYKMDGAFYSFVSLGIMGGTQGTGTLNITSTSFEGLDSELHMTIDGGNVNIQAPDDGINVNEDDISIFTLLDGVLTISSEHGDGIDSNGYVVLNGGKLDITAGNSKINSAGEAGIDTEKQYYISSNASYTWKASSSNSSTNPINQNPTPPVNDNKPNTQTPVTVNPVNQNNNNQNNTESHSEEDEIPFDADVLSSYIKTSRGETKINIGMGNNLSFISDDKEAYNPRKISESGNVFRLEREVNTFSGIVIGR